MRSATVGTPNGRVPPFAFGISTRRTGGGKELPAAQRIAEFVEVAREVGLELRNRLPIHASRSLVGLHTLEGLPDFPLRDLERLCLVHGLLPFPVGPWPRPNNAAPSLQPHYRAFDATTGCSAPAPRFGTLALTVGAACGFSLYARRRDEAQVLTFHTKAWSNFAPPTCRMPL